MLGLIAGSARSAVIVSSNSLWRYLPGSAEASTVPDTKAWRSNTFNETAWALTPAPFLYTTAASSNEPPFWPGGPGFAGTWINGMQNNYASIYLRKTFVVTNPSELTNAHFGAKCDDGFIAWLNGAEILRFNMPAGDPTFSGFFASGSLTEPVPWNVSNYVSSLTNLLVAGTNVLAVQVFNVNLTSSDLGFECHLDTDLVDSAPPSILSVDPAPGAGVTNMTQVTVRFSEPVVGVDASDLRANGQQAVSLVGGGDLYVFSFLQPPQGAIVFSWAPGHGITDMASPANAFDAGAPGSTWQYTLLDLTPPYLTTITPSAGTSVRTLTQIEVHFSESVSNVNAADLLVNGVAATNVVDFGQDVFVFSFPQPATGVVTVAWAAAHDILDTGNPPNAFAGGTWNYTLDPNASLATVRINEFLAANQSGIRDEDGAESDWIELHNSGATAVDLAGWYLTDDAGLLTKWRFPAVSIPAGGYLLVWASNKNRTNSPSALHTNFRLEKGGEYLALVLADGVTVASAFSPAFPVQYDDVSYGSDRVEPSFLGYFATPTPRAANSTAGSGFSPDVSFSVASSTFQNNFTLTLSTDDTNSVIRYVVVTSMPSVNPAPTNLPTSSSTLYTGPITVDGTVQIRARAFPTQAGYLPGPVRTESYIKISAAAAAFTSDVPIILIHDFGGGVPPATYHQTAVVMVFDTNTPNARASMANPPVVSSRAGVHIRGSSTEGLPQKSFALETWDEYNQDRAVPFLDMPDDSDWVLFAPNAYDRSLIHNPLAHELARLQGHYSPRTRFAEVFLNTAGGTVNYSAPAGGDYFGAYIVEEKIKQGRDRVDIAALAPENTNAPAVTGGYLMKIDRQDSNERSFSAAAESIIYVDPDMADYNTDPRRAFQENYIKGYFNSFYSALTGPNATNPVTGYAAYIDPDQWVDNHIVNTFTFCVDGYRLSGFFHKDRDKRIMQGPLWDFDRALGTGWSGGDNRCFNPMLWRVQATGDQGTDFFGNTALLGKVWWQYLFKDIDFWQKWIDRWTDLRRDSMSTSNLAALVDQFGNQVREAQAREAARWTEPRPRSGTISANGYTYTFSGSYQGELDFLKQWLADRAAFIDGNFLRPPQFNVPEGTVSPGTMVTLTAPTVEANSTIYYTLDGTDPRLPGGGVRPGALSALNSTFVTINSNARIFARNWNANHFNITNYPGSVGGNPWLSSPWSGPLVSTYVVTTPDLRITELMYHPAPPPAGNTNDADAFEYIELRNTGGSTLSLIGFRLTNGVEFTFSATNAITSLAAGERVLIVKNLAAFASRYPSATNRVAGEYAGSLDNGGESIALVGPLFEPILNFSYSDQWYPPTDGLGFSLVTVDDNAATTAWGLQSQWRASSYDGGSPGVEDPAQSEVGVILVNELLTDPIPPDIQVVELFNPGTNDVDVGGWFLTDNISQPKKYQLPSGTIVPAGGFALINEIMFNFGGMGFRFSPNGEEIYLLSGSTNGFLTGYSHGFQFGAAEMGVTFGRHVNSQGFEHFVAQVSPTLGTNNAGPRVGPLVISEIMYHPVPLLPTDPDASFIELENITATNIALFHATEPTNTWRLRNAVDFDFPVGVTLPPGEKLVVVSFDPQRNPTALASFRSLYGVTTNVPIYGPWRGGLDNDGETVELKMPDPTASGVAIPQVLVEEVRYFNTPPWPLAADGMGASLQRLLASAYGNDPTNWKAAYPSPGTNYLSGQPPAITQQSPNATLRVGTNLTLSIQVSGDNPMGIRWSFNGVTIAGATSTNLVLTNLQVSQSGQYLATALNPYGSVASTPIVLSVLQPLSITTQPTNISEFPYRTAVFTLGTAGSQPISYQWFKDGSPISGANSASLIKASLSVADAGNYSVTASNPISSVTSTTATLTILTNPIILQQPQDTAAMVGSNATFTVVATSSTPLRYQWRTNGIAIPGATNSSYYIPNVQTNHYSIYTVLVTDDFGFVLSSPASLVITIKPTITFGAIPAVPVLFVGENVTLTVGAIGTVPLAYRWRSNNIFFRTNFPVFDPSNSVTLTNLQLGQAGQYQAVLTNVATNGFNIGSTNAYITVMQRLTNGFARPGSNYMFSFTNCTRGPRNANEYTNQNFYGSFMLRWQWWFNETNLLRSGTNNMVITNLWLSLTNVQVANEGVYKVTATNNNGTFLSQTATLTVLRLPSFVEQPLSQSVLQGGLVAFNSVVDGSAPIGYQWLQNGSPVLNATNPSYTIVSALAGDGGDYTLVVTNSEGSRTSQVASLTVLRQPGILIQPTNQFAWPGSTVELTAQADGSEPLTYKWWFNQTNLLVESTNATLTLSNVQPSQAGNYQLVVNNPYGVAASDVITLTIPAPPQIDTHPANLTVISGSNAVFSVAATGLEPISYAWFFNGTTPLPEVSPVLVLTNVQAPQDGDYHVIVSNPAGSTTSAIARLTVLLPPIITQQPTNQTQARGATALFSVQANGTGPLAYQWQFNGVDINEANEATLTLHSVDTTNAGPYRVIITNVAGVVTSEVATLTVMALPIITTQPSNQFVLAGADATFAVVADGAAPLTYQWWFNQTNLLDGESASSLTISNAQAAAEGAYFVTVSNSAGVVTSEVATLTVLVPPTIAAQPTNLTVFAGSNAVFAVIAHGTSPLAYQWFFNQTNVLAWAEGSALGLTNVQPANAGLYHVVVTNVAGMVTSETARLVVVTADMVKIGGITLPGGTNAGFGVSFEGVAGLSYTVLYREHVDTGIWQTLTNIPPLATDQTISIQDLEAVGQNHRFYRIVTPMQP